MTDLNKTYKFENSINAQRGTVMCHELRDATSCIPADRYVPAISIYRVEDTRVRQAVSDIRRYGKAWG